MNRVMKTSLMEERHTADNIRNDFNKMLKEYSMENKNIICVTDSAANMIAVCRLIRAHRLPCIAHKANTLIQNDLLENPSMKVIADLLTKMRAGQKALMYRYDKLRQIRELDNQNQLALLLNEICELEQIVAN